MSILIVYIDLPCDYKPMNKPTDTMRWKWRDQNPFEVNKWLFRDALANYKLQHQGKDQKEQTESIDQPIIEDAHDFIKTFSLQYKDPIIRLLSQAA